jgi:hypothetical protein
MAADKKILSQTISKLDVVLDMMMVNRRFGTQGKGVAGIKLMMEFLKADLSALGPAHAV